uniref:Uncharacterized protein n=1 Tax=Astyanax mexicanus TaxID=7994 RepID=A0A8B9GQA8_ASTMX
MTPIHPTDGQEVINLAFAVQWLFKNQFRVRICIHLSIIRVLRALDGEPRARFSRLRDLQLVLVSGEKGRVVVCVQDLHLHVVKKAGVSELAEGLTVDPVTDQKLTSFVVDVKVAPGAVRAYSDTSSRKRSQVNPGLQLFWNRVANLCICKGRIPIHQLMCSALMRTRSQTRCSRPAPPP